MRTNCHFPYRKPYRDGLLLMIVLLIFISRDYWNLDPTRIESQQELWHQILKDKKEKPASSKKKS